MIKVFSANEINEDCVGYSFKELQNSINIETVMSYIAGFFDGEGTVMIGKTIDRIYMLRVFITNTELDILIKIQQFLKYGKILYHDKDRNPDKWKDSYRIWFNTTDGIKFLESTYPYLIIKKERVKVALEFGKRVESMQMCGTKLSDKEVEIRKEYYLKMKELNKRGPSDDSDKNIILDEDLEKINNKYIDDQRQGKLEF